MFDQKTLLVNRKTTIRVAKSILLWTTLSLLNACGGTDDSTGNKSNPLPVSFAVQSNAGEGTSISPTSLQVENGKMATFNLTLDPNYQDLEVTGCGGTLEGHVYTTSPVTQDCEVTAKATLAAYVLNFSVNNGKIMDAAMLEELPQTVTALAGSVLEVVVVPNLGYRYDEPFRYDEECTGYSRVKSIGTRHIIRPQEHCDYHVDIRPIDSNGDGIPDAEQDKYMLHGTTLSPSKVFLKDLSTTSFVVEVHATGVTELVYCIRGEGFGAQGRCGDDYATIILRDDGAGADKLASDGLFTGRFQGVENIGAPLSFNSYNGQVATLYGEIRAYSEGVQVFPVNPSNPSRILLVLDNTVPVPALRAQGEGVGVTNNFIVIEREEFSRTYNYLSVARLAARYLEQGYNIYTRTDDHILYASSAGGFYLPLQNNTTGIGASLFDVTAFYGLPAELEGLISFPGDPYGSTFNHEILHRWNTYLDNPDLLLQAMGGHSATSSQPGVMGGYRIEQRADGQYYVIYQNDQWESSFANDFELYAAGMMAPEDVRPTIFCPEFSNTLRFNDYVNKDIPLPSECIKEISAQDVIDVYGARTPAYSGLLNLRVANIIPIERPLTNAELAYYELRAKQWARKDYSDTEHAKWTDDATPVPFNYATRQRGDLDFSIRLKPTPEWPPSDGFGEVIK